MQRLASDTPMRILTEWALQAHSCYCKRREAQTTRAALEALDDRVLLDLGFARSEIESVAAEASGEAERTRALEWT
jgi:uncharacterized protein YjiS (DUF1127 family)